MLDKLAKVLVKQVLKLAAPVIGEVTADVGGEVIGLLIDRRKKSEADAVESRLAARVASDLRAIVVAEHIAEQDVEALEATVTTMLGDEKSIAMAWASAGFNPDTAARAVLASGAGVIVGLSDGERALCLKVAAAVFRALDNERRVVDATEAEFRRAVLSQLEKLSQTATLATGHDTIVASSMLVVPSRAFIAGVSPPGALLRADIDRPVPFHGREKELDELVAWSIADAPLSVRLVTGPGGMGKSRLLIELSRRLRIEGWAAGFLDAQIPATAAKAWTVLVSGPKPVLAIIDYAENRREQIGTLVAAAHASYGAQRIRIVLLARAADDWWDAVRREGGAASDVLSGPATTRMALQGLAPSEAARRTSYGTAVDHFSKVLAHLIVTAPPDFTDRTLERACCCT